MPAFPSIPTLQALQAFRHTRGKVNQRKPTEVNGLEPVSDIWHLHISVFGIWHFDISRFGISRLHVLLWHFVIPSSDIPIGAIPSFQPSPSGHFKQFKRVVGLVARYIWKFDMSEWRTRNVGMGNLPREKASLSREKERRRQPPACGERGGAIPRTRGVWQSPACGKCGGGSPPSLKAWKDIIFSHGHERSLLHPINSSAKCYMKKPTPTP